LSLLLSLPEDSPPLQVEGAEANSPFFRSNRFLSFEDETFFRRLRVSTLRFVTFPRRSPMFSRRPPSLIPCVEFPFPWRIPYLRVKAIDDELARGTSSEAFLFIEGREFPLW